jgi:hypothetical protein
MSKFVNDITPTTATKGTQIRSIFKASAEAEESKRSPRHRSIDHNTDNTRYETVGDWKVRALDQNPITFRTQPDNLPQQEYDNLVSKQAIREINHEYYGSSP